MVRAGEDARFYEDFKNCRIVSIGWDKVGDLSKAQNLAGIKQKVEEKYEDGKNGWKAITASQLNRFVYEFKEGDYVVTYNPEGRVYLVGKISGPYRFDSSRKESCHTRPVNWEMEVPRDRLSVSTRNTLGAISTLFEIKSEAASDILTSSRTTKEPETKQVKEELDELRKETVRKANEFIKDELSELDWEEVQLLVAGVLRAMGYKTRVSPKGSDRGKDIEASPDGLGLTEPHVMVEVKHREGATDAPRIRSFVGGLRPRHKGIYVSTGGYTREAKYEADRAEKQVTLVDLDDLVGLITQYYDEFDAEARTLIPLRKIYWPE